MLSAFVTSVTSDLASVLKMSQSGDETFLDKSGIDEMPLITKLRNGSAPGDKVGQVLNSTILYSIVIQHGLRLNLQPSMSSLILFKSK